MQSLPLLTLEALAEAVREPLIICSVKQPGAHTPGQVLTANEMACTLLNRDIASITALPLNLVLTTSSGRSPPPGLVSKCTARCAGAPSVSVECDCRVFEPPSMTPLLFYHLALVDRMDSDEHASSAAAEAASTPGSAGSGNDYGGSAAAAGATATTVTADQPSLAVASGVSECGSSTLSPRVKELADVQIEPLRILLVEDDAFAAMAIEELCCKQCDFQLSTVGSGEDCLEMLEEDAERPMHERFNLILCDVMMHGMDGCEVLREVRARYGDEITVIMLSANEQQTMVEACIRAGADSYLFKPLRVADFSNIWQFVMQQRCHKLQAERREMRFLRSQQLARMKQINAEKLRAIALADAEREKAQRERAEIEAARERAAQKADFARQREEMQKEMMRVLHRQVRKYWLLAHM